MQGVLLLPMHYCAAMGGCTPILGMFLKIIKSSSELKALQVTTTDQETGEVGREPLMALGKFRSALLTLCRNLPA